MISFLRGTLQATSPTHLLVDVGGVGYHVNIPLSSYDASLKPDETVTVLTYLHVREDAMALFGFLTEAERSLFTLLISVSGIGPPLAQKVLSGITIPDFHRLVVAGDARGLTRIKGVGPKLAQRLILELKDRIADLSVAEAAIAQVEDDPGTEAVNALVALGASPIEARKVVGEVLETNGEASVEEVIRQALGKI